MKISLIVSALAIALTGSAFPVASNEADNVVAITAAPTIETENINESAFQRRSEYNFQEKAKNAMEKIYSTLHKSGAIGNANEEPPEIERRMRRGINYKEKYEKKNSNILE